MNRDEDHLRLLSIFHYVWGGLTVCLSCFGLIHIVVGIGLTAASFQQSGPPKWFGPLFAMVGMMVVLVGVVSGGLTIWAGRCLDQRRYRTFCMVVAVLSCFSFPFGTALGVFTLVVLSRPSVKALFEPPIPPVTA